MRIGRPDDQARRLTPAMLIFHGVMWVSFPDRIIVEVQRI